MPKRNSSTGGGRRTSRTESSDKRKSSSPRKSAGEKSASGKKSFAKPTGRTRRDEGGAFESKRPRKSFDDKPTGRKSYGDKPGYDRRSSGKSREERPVGGSTRSRKSFGDKPSADRRSFGKSREEASDFGSKRPRKSVGDSAEFGKKPFGKPTGRSSRREGDSSDFGAKKSSPRGYGDKPAYEKKSFGKSEGGFKKRDDSSSFATKRSGGRGERSFDDKKSFGDKPDFRRRSGDDKPAFKKRREDAEERPVKRASRTTGFSKRRDDEVPKEFVSKRKRIDSSKPFREKGEGLDVPMQSEKMRLNRYIANSGICSRREADNLITMGLITVNGQSITELGYKVDPGDEVRYEGRVLRAEKPVYVLMNKPKGFLTTTNDPQERKTVMHLLENHIKERIYPVGRLDRNTTGLLLLTNDGDLADKLMHPSYKVKKIYKVELDRALTKADYQKIMEGIQLEEGRAIVDDLAIIGDDGKTVGIELHIGWNRVVRRIFESLEYEVVKLDRSVYAGLDKKELSRGEWRFLKKEEIVRLKHLQ